MSAPKIGYGVAKAVREWVEKHPERVAECEKNDMGDGPCYDVLLAPGWSYWPDASHVLMERSSTRILSMLRDVRVCACGDCLALLRKNDDTRETASLAGRS